MEIVEFQRNGCCNFNSECKTRNDLLDETDIVSVNSKLWEISEDNYCGTEETVYKPSNRVGISYLLSIQTSRTLNTF